jgi:hypothetical protein
MNLMGCFVGQPCAFAESGKARQAQKARASLASVEANFMNSPLAVVLPGVGA